MPIINFNAAENALRKIVAPLNAAEIGAAQNLRRTENGTRDYVKQELDYAEYDIHRNPDRETAVQWAADHLRNAKLAIAGASKSHVVKPDDTLWAISRELLGAGNRYMELAEANREEWTRRNKEFNPDRIFPGMVFKASANADFSVEQRRIAQLEDGLYRAIVDQACDGHRASEMFVGFGVFLAERHL